MNVSDRALHESNVTPMLHHSIYYTYAVIPTCNPFALPKIKIIPHAKASFNLNIAANNP